MLISNCVLAGKNCLQRQRKRKFAIFDAVMNDGALLCITSEQREKTRLASFINFYLKWGLACEWQDFSVSQGDLLAIKDVKVVVLVWRLIPDRVRQSSY